MEKNIKIGVDKNDAKNMISKGKEMAFNGRVLELMGKITESMIERIEEKYGRCNVKFELEPINKALNIFLKECKNLKIDSVYYFNDEELYVNMEIEGLTTCTFTLISFNCIKIDDVVELTTYFLKDIKDINNF